MPERLDIVVTWPKTQSLDVYVRNLSQALRQGQQINYRVSRLPKWEDGVLGRRPARCYMVHDGAVRGYTTILETMWRGAGEVKRVGEPGFWPQGWYIVRSASWIPIKPVPMRGFQGWRWYYGGD